jgi:dihydrofolate synthase/folylpolyglutamate synthase
MAAPFNMIRFPVADTWELALAGSHQRWNAAIAFAAVVSAGLRPEPRVMVEALSKVEWPGRFQSVLDGRVVLDGAHNPPAAQRLVQTWRERFGTEHCTLIVGVLEDKDVDGVISALAPIAARILCVPVRNPRTSAAADLARLAAERAPGIPCETRPDLPTALADARTHGERTLIAGSLFLVGEALAHLGLMEGEQEMSAQ